MVAQGSREKVGRANTHTHNTFVCKRKENFIYFRIKKMNDCCRGRERSISSACIKEVARSHASNPGSREAARGDHVNRGARAGSLQLLPAQQFGFKK